MEISMQITGGCLCRAVRYEIKSEPVAAVTCWCRACQYLAAGSSTVNLIVDKESVSVTGVLASYESLADSGNKMVRRFCPHCGTPVFSDSSGRPKFTVLRAGTLDDPEIAKPSRAIWVS